mmetsp:Transcript_7142/g.18505  ORF Transcript_7142/g.18505 Transcript_7142/m.18505 type:complete len:94 (+) Transcript_7142:662-943(+)
MCRQAGEKCACGMSVSNSDVRLHSLFGWTGVHVQVWFVLGPPTKQNINDTSRTSKKIKNKHGRADSFFPFLFSILIGMTYLNHPQQNANNGKK